MDGTYLPYERDEKYLNNFMVNPERKKELGRSRSRFS
jgi:hypothetical protein